MAKNYNPYFRELAEIKQAFASALTPENCIVLCRQLQRDCLHGSNREKSWARLFTLLDILGLKGVSPDRAKADEVKVYMQNPPSMIEKAMRGERPKPMLTNESTNPKPVEVTNHGENDRDY